MGSECWVPSRIQPPTMNKEQEFSAEQDEEKLILRRLRNSIDDLQRGYRRLDYQMTRVMTKSDRAKETRENIELIEDKVCIRGQPVPCIHPQGGGYHVQEGSEGRLWTPHLQGLQTQQQNHAQFSSYHRSVCSTV